MTKHVKIAFTLTWIMITASTGRICFPPLWQPIFGIILFMTGLGGCIFMNCIETRK